MSGDDWAERIVAVFAAGGELWIDVVDKLKYGPDGGDWDVDKARAAIKALVASGVLTASRWRPDSNQMRYQLADSGVDGAVRCP